MYVLCMYISNVVNVKVIIYLLLMVLGYIISYIVQKPLKNK